MEFQHYLMAILGGLMVGSAAGRVLLSNGPEAGGRGTARRGPSAPTETAVDAAWLAVFLLGLVAGGALLTWLDPAGLPVGQIAPIELMVGAGLLMGAVARVGACPDAGRDPRHRGPQSRATEPAWCKG